MKPYILIVNPANSILSVSVSKEEFEYSVYGNNNIKANDQIVVFFGHPINEIRMLLEATRDSSNNCVYFKKSLDVSCGVKSSEIEDFTEVIDRAIAESRDLIEIDEGLLEDIRDALMENVIRSLESSDNLKSRFKLYIINVLKLKSLRQVRDMETLSNSLVSASVISKNIFQISDVEEYRQVLQIIKNSDEYQNYKAARKAKSPNSGLPCDQGLSNYEKFLIYLSGENNSQEDEGLSGFPNPITGYQSDFKRNRIIFGAPGTGKSFLINEERKLLLGQGNESSYERVTFHPDYSYASFVGSYKPVMVKENSVPADRNVDFVITELSNKDKTAQEKYDALFEQFVDDDALTRLPVLLGVCTDEDFKTRKKDGTYTADDNIVERNTGKAIRKYVNLKSSSCKNKNEIAYEYVPGPFMRVLVEALKNARTKNPKPFLLIIEEINRANVAAVFGEVFQLLDRGDKNASEYPIQASEDIKNYLAKELNCKPEECSKIYIPDNMFIWATMNSADQGVFPMDTAFKRRWDFTYLGIDDNDEDIRDKYVTIGSNNKQRFVWNELRKSINNFLADKNINEDKQLGPYFISRRIIVPEHGNEIDSRQFTDVFKNKVLMYLFDDAAKQKRSTLFEGSNKGSSRYSKICEAFDEQGVDIFHSSIRNAVNYQIITDVELPIEASQGVEDSESQTEE